ncbi:MAG: hypothetical protein PF448_13480, partial [Bacteroidales bacterium]|nr:hypothetical protein [Bacteroidales bacterium]
MKRLFLLAVAALLCYCAYSQADLLALDTLSYFEQIELIEGTNAKQGLKAQMSEAQIKRYFRYRAFWDNRVDNNGSFFSYMNAWKRISNDDSKSGTRIGSDPELSFEAIGPFEHSLDKINHIGRTSSIAVDPTNSSVVYLGSMSGGLWKTENALVSTDDVQWECLTDNFPSIGALDIAINPSNHNEVYFIASFYSSHIGDTRRYSAGIYKSSDAGETWVLDFPINPADKIMLTRIVYHPTNNNIMYALGHNSLYKRNTGGTWSEIGGGDISDADQLWEIVIDPVNPDNIYVSGRIFGSNENGLLKSNDGGYTFNDYTNYLIGSDYTERIAIDYNENDNYLYAYYKNGTLKKTMDGQNWLNADPTFTSFVFQNFVGEVDIAPNGECYVGGVRLYHSDDYSNFDELESSGSLNQIHDDIRDIAFSNTSTGAPVFIATDGGVCRSLSGGRYNWESINGNLSLSQFFDFDITENDTEFMLGGTADCGTLRRNQDGTWSQLMASDGGGTAISDFNKNHCIGSYGASTQSIRYSTNGGDSFPFSNINGYLYDTPIEFSQHRPNYVYCGKFNLMLSTNGGQTFVNHVTSIPGHLTVISESPVNSSYLSFGCIERTTPRSNAHVYLNFNYDPSNPNSNWLIYDENDLNHLGFDGSCPITDIEFTEIPSRDGTVYVSLGGFQDGVKVLKAQPDLGGGSLFWQNITYNLENIPINSLEETTDGCLYAATDFGLYYLVDGGTTWNLYSNNLPLMAIDEIHINNTSGEMILSTYGRGVWRSDLYCGYDVMDSEVITTNTLWNTRKKLRGNLTVSNSSTLTLTDELRLSDQSIITIDNGSKLIVENGGIIKNGCDVYFGGTINVEPGGILELGDGGIIQMGDDGLINVKAGTSSNGMFSYEGTAGTGAIILSDDNTCLNIGGELSIEDDLIFTFTGSGYIKFSNPGDDNTNNIFCGSGASIVLQGSGQNDKIMEVQQSSVRFPAELSSFELRDGKIEMGAYAR